jgi:cbb3-type cytochrome oxidase subunit 3
LVVVVVQKIETGAWDAYLKTQEKYGHGFHQPFDAAWARMKPAFESSLLTIDQAPAVQTVFVTIVLMAVLAAVAWAARRRRVTRLDVLVVIWSVAFWAFPLTQAHVSLYRSQAALLPLAILVARLPVVLIYVIAGAAAWLTVPMTILFLQAKLV